MVRLGDRIPQTVHNGVMGTPVGLSVSFTN